MKRRLVAVASITVLMCVVLGNIVACTPTTTTEHDLTITAASDSKVYDGTPLTNSNYSITAGTLAADHTLVSVTVTGSQTDVGSSDNVPSSAVIMDNGSDMTANYNITYVNGTLTVTTRTLEITAASDSKAYDETPLTNSGYNITAGTLAADHSLVSVTVTGSQTDVGSSANVPSGAVIMDNGTDVTANYNITYVNGNLTVTGEEGYGEEYVDQDSFVLEFNPVYNANSYSLMKCGEYPASFRNWVYLKFDFDDVVIPENAGIIRAHLWIHVDSTMGISFGHTQSHCALAPWSETEITWENQPNIDTMSSGGKTILNSGWHYFSIEDLVVDWLDGTYENYGLCLRITPNSGLLNIDSKGVNGAYIDLEWQTP